MRGALAGGAGFGATVLVIAYLTTGSSARVTKFAPVHGDRDIGHADEAADVLMAACLAAPDSQAVLRGLTPPVGAA